MLKSVRSNLVQNYILYSLFRKTRKDDIKKGCFKCSKSIDLF